MPMRISVYAGFENGPYVIRVNKSERGHAPRHLHGGVISARGRGRFGKEEEEEEKFRIEANKDF